MENPTQEVPEPESSVTNDGTGTTSRRQFARGAAAGTAVLFSLGNRPAWSQAGGSEGLDSAGY